MTERPAPLVPAECTMAGNDWFPLHFQRLRKSKWWRRASDTARARNVMMWGEAYQASPAGSLPDDDDELAEAAGYGMDIAAFMSVRDEIMAPWVLCSDGRWYHPTVCEVVLDAWSKASERRKKDALRKAEQRANLRGKCPAEPVVRADNAVVPRDNPENSRDIGTQTQQTGQDKRDADASLSPSGDGPSKKYPEEFEACWQAYPHVKGRSSKTKAHGVWRRLPPALRPRLPSAIACYARDGREPKQDCGAPAMERWLRDERFADWLDADALTSPPQRFPGPLEVRAAVVRAKDEDWTRSYLDPCGWRDLPDKAITSPNRYVLDKLKVEVGDHLAALNVGLHHAEKTAA